MRGRALRALEMRGYAAEAASSAVRVLQRRAPGVVRTSVRTPCVIRTLGEAQKGSNGTRGARRGRDGA
ncbi:hypothetical protein ACFOLD_06630 [Kocuria carniphila]|uniref:hypothetical protein n=1 Tax=Kocuria carniphila TaxID=262208 RepID=UPI003606C89B